jgi:hypothetical protein
MSVLTRGANPLAASPQRSVRPIRASGAGAGWWARMADDREMVGVKLVLLTVVVILALVWEVPGWAP